MNKSERRLGFVGVSARVPLSSREAREIHEISSADVVHIAPGVEVRRMGSIERGRNYRWVDGWAVFVDGLEHQPWMTKKEAIAFAKRVAKDRGTRETRESHHVADFNSLDDLIAHAHHELGATHVVVAGAHTQIFFPRGGQYPYEAAKVWRKGGYWHAEGPGARTGVKTLPKDAQPIEVEGGGRRAAEPPRVSARGISNDKKQMAFRRLDHFFSNPTAQKKGFQSEDAAAHSAATLLAGQMKLKYNTAIEIVQEWYQRG